MKLLLQLLLGLLAGVGLAVLLAEDRGYVLIAFDMWTVELRFTVAVLLLLVTFLALYFGIRLLINTWRLPRQVQSWNDRRHLRLARRSLTRGLIEMSEGKWASAEKRLLRHAEHSETPLLNYLSAARAAQLQGEHERRDSYLKLAHESMPSADVAVGLTQAELQLAHQQLEQALATLKHLRSVAPKHAYVLRLLLRLYEQLGDWEQLNELLPELRQRKVGTKESLGELEVRIHRALLQRASQAPAKARLSMVWDQVPRPLRGHPSLLGDYASYLIARGDGAQCEPLLRELLRHQFDEHLVDLYGQVPAEQPNRQLAIAEALLADHGENGVLLLALGRMCLRSQLWGKARGYLEASIGASGPSDAYRELGHLLEQMGQERSALDVYRSGLAETGGPEPIALPSHIGPAKTNQPLLKDEPDVEPPPPHGARPVSDVG